MFRSHRRSSRWERKSSERDTRERSRRRRDDNDDDDRESTRKDYSSKKPPLGASGTEVIGYKSYPPNSTIMIRGLAQHITEIDIRQDIIHSGLMPKEIRLVRTKDTGISRGFAFVEFSTLEEATRWMDLKEGVLILQNQYRAIMQYSIPKATSQVSDIAPSQKAAFDWFCAKCGAQNFKRRENCFKCFASRTESEEGGSGSDEVSEYVTKTIMLRNLDALTTEDSVIQILSKVIPEQAKKISGVCIGRDPLTSTSRGICYLGTDSTLDALTLYQELTSLEPPLNIDEKVVTVSYCKYNMGDTEKAHEQALQAAFPNASQPSTYVLSDVNKLAEYAASRYAKTVLEYQQYFEYYKNYFSEQISAGNCITLQNNQTDATNVAAAVAQAAIQRTQANKNLYAVSQVSVPDGTETTQYPVPDVSKYVYDKNSGYYYDPSTTLFYDPNSTYYWNSVLQKYLYYDHEKSTYVLVELPYDYMSTQQSVENTMEQKTKKQKPEKQDKIKVAKKVVKDMERWAKTLNQKKDLSSSSSLSISSSEGNLNTFTSSASADIGYSVLENKNNNSLSTNYSCSYDIPTSVQDVIQTSPAIPMQEENTLSDEETLNSETDFLDFKKLICRLCKRQLLSAEALSKHGSLSELHKKNLEAYFNNKRNENNCDKTVYRDRAKERRMKYGLSDEQHVSELKEKYLKSLEMANISTATSVNEPISSENVGSRLLQKMGWTEGQGLGKTNQGRTTIIQAEQRNSTVGLGNKVAYTAVAGESYKDSVKKVLYARYQELD